MIRRTYFSVPGVASVTWDEVDQLVLVEWEGWANSTEFTALLDAEIAALTEHHGSRLLADCRLQRVLNPHDQDRANDEWIRRAAEAGLKMFAIVMPRSELAAEHLRERTGQTPRSAFKVAYFEDVEQARAWLRA